MEHICALLLNEKGLCCAFEPRIVPVKVDVAAGASAIVLLQVKPALANLKAPHLLAHTGFAG